MRDERPTEDERGGKRGRSRRHDCRNKRSDASRRELAHSEDNKSESVKKLRERTDGNGTGADCSKELLHQGKQNEEGKPMRMVGNGEKTEANRKGSGTRGRSRSHEEEEKTNAGEGAPAERKDSKSIITVTSTAKRTAKEIGGATGALI